MSDDNVDPSTTPAPAADTSNANETAAPQETQESQGIQEKVEEPKNRFQDRINQLTKKNNISRQEVNEERKRSAALEERLKALESKTEAPKAPKEEDFEDYSQYQAANSEHVVNLATNAAYDRIQVENNERAETARQTVRDDSIKAKKASFDTNVEGKKANFENFEEIAYGHGFMSTDMAERLFEMDKGPEVAYHLGSNLDIAEKIFTLPPIQQAIELTKLEYQVEALKPKLVSDAPDPLTPIGNSEQVHEDPDKMTADQWQEWRYRQLANK